MNLKLNTVLALQRQAYLKSPIPSYSERVSHLKSLQQLVRENKEKIVAAINEDFGHRSTHETLFAEVFPVLDGIDHILRELKAWMCPQKRGVDLVNFFGATNTVVPQPLGVVGVIVPWNFPLNLSILPVAYAFAAGNRAMVKLSENSSQLSRLLTTLVPRYFRANKLAVFEETGEVGIAFSKLKFDHLLFTGSAQTGRAVMKAAAENLVPVTLELGGKCPAIVFDDYSLKTAVERIMFVKMLNAGQICTTVDYLFVPRGTTPLVLQHARAFVRKRYGSIDSKDFTSMISDSAYRRVRDAIDEARHGGARVHPLMAKGHPYDDAAHRIAPVAVTHTPDDCALMTREIFGPVLPVIEYDTIEEVFARINKGARPLAVYPFTHSQTKQNLVLERVMSGGVSINDALFHVAQHDLPFGGVGDSGMGHYHGKEGFETFSKMRPIFKQARISVAQLLWPPYKQLATLYLKWLTR